MDRNSVAALCFLCQRLCFWDFYAFEILLQYYLPNTEHCSKIIARAVLSSCIFYTGSIKPHYMYINCVYYPADKVTFEKMLIYFYFCCEKSLFLVACNVTLAKHCMGVVGGGGVELI